LAHSFRGFGPWFTFSIAFRSTASKKHHDGRAWRRKAVDFMMARKQKAREREKGVENNHTLQRHTLGDLLLSARPYTPNSSFTMNL
jgi:hypothetical protein